MRTTLFRSAPVLVVLFLVACDSSDENPSSNELPPTSCTTFETSGGQVPLKSDGTLDTTAAKVWPNRADEGPALTADEHVQACGILSHCLAPNDSKTQIEYFLLCVSESDVGRGSGLGFFWEERAVHTVGKQTRWAVEARKIIAAKSSCAQVLLADEAATQSAPGVPSCEEIGCDQQCVEPGKISCTGNIAHFTDMGGVERTRDCALSLTNCDVSSPTGCTDRLPTACTHSAVDLCDGNVRLGCDGTGRVSFHDCARIPGGACKTVDGRGECVIPDAGECQPGSVSCSGGAMTACFEGQTFLLSCADIGLGDCPSPTCIR